MRGKFIIQGGNQLSGEIEVKGAKNASLPIMCATVLAEGEFVLENVPDLRDVVIMVKLLECLGLKVEKLNNSTYKIVNSGLTSVEAPYELVSEMRASFIIAGSLLGKEKKARVALPGGCALGARAVDQHLKAFEQLGVQVTTEHGFVNLSADNLVGNEVDVEVEKLKIPSVGATENVMMAAVLAKGETIIHNAAKEPEIVDLGNFLIKMGANIQGLGTDKIIISGVEELHACEYSIMSDRIEAGTYIILSLITGGNIKIKNVNLDDLPGFVAKLEEMGVDFKQEENLLSVNGNLETLKNIKLETQPHPGFPTDLQPQMMVLLSLIHGMSEIKETIFSNRLMLVPELNRMGSKIVVEDRMAMVEGDVKLEGVEVTAPDLRAGVSLVLAGLIADNTTIINEIKHVERGYENLAERLQKVGAKIERVI
ncbi:MAG: UDP-N-acetylglucosamine 1-carboxyvinyltransferase [Candidatus Magasanikiibacteriota bacterium]